MKDEDQRTKGPKSKVNNNGYNHISIVAVAVLYLFVVAFAPTLPLIRKWLKGSGLRWAFKTCGFAF